MVKGISRQVIVVHPQEAKLFDQAIFILREDALGREGVTDEALLKEADRLLRSAAPQKRGIRSIVQLFWTALGAGAMGLIWLLSSIL